MGWALLFGVLPEDTLGIFITVADAKDGRVMATVSGFALGSFLKKPDKLIGSAIDKAFKTFPSSGAVTPHARLLHPSGGVPAQCAGTVILR